MATFAAMRKNKKDLNVILEGVTILEMAAEGKCIARHNEKVIFVDHVAPGDVADLKITRSRSKFSEATPFNITSFSPLRTDPFCEHFGVCGGCKWQHINYETQLHFKAKQVKDNLERIGKISLPEIHPILPSEAQTYYRNKLEYTFSNKRWLTEEEIRSDGAFERKALGFHIPGRFDKIIDINNCYLQPDPSNAIRLAIRDFALENDYTFFDLVLQQGLLRNLIIRTSISGETMVIVQFFENDPEKIQRLMAYIKAKFSGISSLLYIINEKKNETYQDQEIITYSGNPYITEKMEDLEFRIGPKSFFQTNAQQAYALYKITRDLANLSGNEVVYDLYTGTGTIANFIARQCKKVIGLEYVEMAIEDAKLNSQHNNITNTVFFAGDIKDLLSAEFIQAHGAPDVVITDPPRAGMHEAVVAMLLQTNAKRIVYVSCNPATQARDLALLDAKYTVTAVQPVDMFPHTQHVENVVLLELKI
jgi:23S rRNA (uracil1939-C5)-methyltransferase